MKNVSDVYMLTPMQQLMLIHARSNLQSDTLFSQFQYTIKGPLEPESFKRAWEHIVLRHPALKTIFLWKDLNKPVQVVKKESQLPWVYRDWRNLSKDEQKKSLAAYQKEDKTAGFDLDRNPPIRFGLFRLEEEVYHLVWSNHHLILDRWCLSILAEELPQVYTSIHQRKPQSLPPAKPFKDYISWLQQQEETDAKSFWQSEFMGYHNVLPLSAIRSSGATDSTPRHVVQRKTLPIDLSEKIQAFARNEHLTMSTVLQSAWGLLMTHYNSLNDTVIGVTVSGRPAELPGVENIVGSFINNLPVRMVYKESEILVQWLKSFQKKMSEMQKFDYVSQDNIQKWCHLPYDKPLFDTLFVYQEATSLELALSDDVRMIGIPEGAKSNIPLTLTIENSDAAITSWISYTANEFSDEAVANLFDQFQQVLKWFVANPGVGLSEISIFSDEERQAMENHRDSHDPIEHTNFPTQRIIDSPRTSLESLIVEIWADLLKLDTVGIYENFFDLGGSSLLAVQLLTKIEQETKVRLPISALFDSPNVSKLADVVSKGDWNPRWKAMVAINEISDQDNEPLFLIPPSATSAMHFAELAKYLEPDFPVYSFTPIGLDTDEEPQNRVEDMAALYIREIRDVQPDGPYQIAGSCFGNLVAYEMAQQLERQGESTILITIDPAFLTQWKPEKRGLLYYLLRTWHFLKSGVLLSEFVMRTENIFKRYEFKKQDRTKKVLLSHDTARISYVVQPFPGKMTYLQSEENHRLGYHLRWNELNNREPDSFVVKNTNHGNLFSSNHLKRVATKITTILEKQAKQP
jgi:thioesterase domain-containing protein/acyl carrier protein